MTNVEKLRETRLSFVNIVCLHVRVIMKLQLPRLMTNPSDSYEEGYPAREVFRNTLGFYSAPGKCLSIPLAYANQKLKLALSCVMRAGIRVVVTRPKSELLTLPEGLLNCAWLNALNRSTRSWSFIFSVMLVSL